MRENGLSSSIQINIVKIIRVYDDGGEHLPFRRKGGENYHALNGLRDDNFCRVRILHVTSLGGLGYVQAKGGLLLALRHKLRG